MLESSVMQPVKSILVVVDLSATAADAVAKAVALARRFGARIELFMCDAERAFMLSQAYIPAGVQEARKSALFQAHRYLESLKELANAPDITITVDSACESPLYESVVRKVLRDHPDLVIKNVARVNGQRMAEFDATDWQLMRTCPAALMLTRGRPWQSKPRLAAAVDVSATETTGLAQGILNTAHDVVQSLGGELEVLYAEPVELEDADREKGARALQALTTQIPDLSPHVHVLAGNPEVSLPRFAQHRGYDAILLGALTHRPGYTAQVGTLTSKLMDALECDFILLKPSAYRSPIAASATRVAAP
jgi:universal stress protein E